MLAVCANRFRLCRFKSEIYIVNKCLQLYRVLLTRPSHRHTALNSYALLTRTQAVVDVNMIEISERARASTEFRDHNFVYAKDIHVRGRGLQALDK